MKQEVGRGDKERAVSSKGGTGPESGQTRPELRVYSSCIKRKKEKVSYFHSLHLVHIFFFFLNQNIILTFPHLASLYPPLCLDTTSFHFFILSCIIIIIPSVFWS